MKPELTQARLKELLHYDPETGVFTWRVSLSNRGPVGKPAGHQRRDGYISLSISGERFYAHRLAFLYQVGEFPAVVVDHIDGDPSNNQWINLRLATHYENHANVGPPRNNKSGVRGVHWNRALGKWLAQASHLGVRHHIGYFSDVREAANAIDSWRISKLGEFARPSNL